MIELPQGIVPNAVTPAAMDFGGWLQPATGAAETRIDRKGGRYGGTFSLPPLPADTARRVLSCILQAHFGDTLRVKWPLLGISQGSPGTPVVAGAGQTGKTLNLRGLNVGYAIKEGFWLTIVDQNGRGYLHNCRSNVRVGSDGLATITLAEALRWPFLDGATVKLALPTIEGKVPAQPWQLSADKFVQVGFALQEVA